MPGPAGAYTPWRFCYRLSAMLARSTALDDHSTAISGCLSEISN